MKKTWILATVAAAVALAGCNREIAVAPAGDGLLRAAIETPTRVAFSDEGAFSWQAGDAVAVSTNAGFKTFTLTSGSGGAAGVFDGDLAGVTSATVAVYPASIAKDDKTVTLPAEYAWAEGQSNAAMYCEAVDLAKVNSFKHLGGILKIRYAEIPADADALVVKAEAKITGDFEIKDGQIAAGAGSDQVKVTFAAGSNPTAFYIPVPTGEYKFAVELQKGGVAIEGTQKATTNAVKVARKALILMAPVEAAPAAKEIARWRCDDAAYLESHSPDWSTEGANDYSHGTGLGIALPEEGAPEGTKMTWLRNSGIELPLVFITAAEGHCAVKAVAADDGYLFTIPGQSLKKGQVIKMDCALASGAKSSPKNWVIKFRTAESADWTVGESPTAFTTASGVTAHITWSKVKIFTAAARFQATYTLPEDITNATVQVFVCAADEETITGSTAAGSTMRLIPLMKSAGEEEIQEYPGPRITVE